MVVEVLLYLSDESVFDVDDLVRLVGHAALVRDDNDGLVLFLVESFEQFHHFHACLGVECAGGFVGEDDFRIGDERAGDSHALLLSTRHLVGIVVGPGQQVEAFEIFQCHLMAFAARHTLIEERQLHVLYRCLEADEVKALEDEADEVVAVFGGATLTEIFDERAVEDVLATVVVVENAQDVEQRRLAGARRSHDGDELALLYVKADAFEHVQWLSTKVGLVDIVKMYHSLVI